MKQAIPKNMPMFEVRILNDDAKIKSTPRVLRIVAIVFLSILVPLGSVINTDFSWFTEDFARLTTYTLNPQPRGGIINEVLKMRKQHKIVRLTGVNLVGFVRIDRRRK